MSTCTLLVLTINPHVLSLDAFRITQTYHVNISRKQYYTSRVVNTRASLLRTHCCVCQAPEGSQPRPQKGDRASHGRYAHAAGHPRHAVLSAPTFTHTHTHALFLSGCLTLVVTLCPLALSCLAISGTQLVVASSGLLSLLAFIRQAKQRKR